MINRKVQNEYHIVDITWLVMAVMIPIGRVKKMAMKQASITPHHGS